jgi:CheY-like chemotaxis protein/CBS domain-containing protein
MVSFWKPIQKRGFVCMNQLVSSPALARDLMNSEVVPLKPGRFEKGLALQFLSGQYSGWPVVDPTRKMLGIVTELRLLQAVSRLTSLDELRVEDTMSTPVYVFENEPIDVVLNLMVQRQVLRMPVVSDRNLIGVISRSQILRHYFPISSSSSRSVSSCAWCERVQDPSDELASKKEGRDWASFLSRNHLTFSDIDLGQAYCPSCLQTLQAPRTTSGSLASSELQAREIRPCLLVVDDDPSVTEMLGGVLQEWGYDVLIARNGREGLDIVRRHSVNGILLDMHMPMMDGRTMLDELRWSGHQMPVLMMSGESDERALRQLAQEGAQGFFLKPFHLTSLQEACYQVFKKYTVEGNASSRCQVV